MRAVRAAMGRAAVFLRGSRPSSAVAAAASQAEGVTALTPARRPFVEKMVVLLRGPRPNPAAEAELGKGGSASRHSARTTYQRKKTYESTSAETWFLAFLITFAFLEGHDIGKRNDQKIAEAMNEHQ